MNERNKALPTCHCCGAKIVSYRHNISKGMVRGLVMLYQVGSSTIADLKLDVNAHNNFQKLRYWDLVRNDNSGVWVITASGREFVEQKAMVRRTVVTYRGERTGYEGEMIGILEAAKGISRKKREYILDDGNL